MPQIVMRLILVQLQAYEKAKASSAAAHKKSAASAVARLSSLKQRAHDLQGSLPQPGLDGRELSRQAVPSPQLGGDEGMLLSCCAAGQYVWHPNSSDV